MKGFQGDFKSVSWVLEDVERISEDFQERFKGFYGTSVDFSRFRKPLEMLSEVLRQLSYSLKKIAWYGDKI